MAHQRPHGALEAPPEAGPPRRLLVASNATRGPARGPPRDDPANRMTSAPRQTEAIPADAERAGACVHVRLAPDAAAIGCHARHSRPLRSPAASCGPLKDDGCVTSTASNLRGYRHFALRTAALSRRRSRVRVPSLPLPGSPAAAGFRVSRARFGRGLGACGVALGPVRCSAGEQPLLDLANYEAPPPPDPVGRDQPSGARAARASRRRRSQLDLRCQRRPYSADVERLL
jgi:hypothetical protein